MLKQVADRGGRSAMTGDLSMRASTVLSVASVAAALGLAGEPDAAACGGCLHPPILQQSESTVVTGHRMILSLSKEQTTLWDQITYTGEPKEFAWVLPIRGKVEVGLSSPLLFESLDQQTRVSVSSPAIVCEVPAGCGPSLTSEGGPAYTSAPTVSSTADGEMSPVTVLDEEVVGPYETVQLSSKDPGALQAWLSAHDYEVPADIAPVIAAYVNEGFDFLALKLVPGAGIRTMRPVRVTYPGASSVLPLRMVAAGTGAITAITLWVLSEGRYETSSAPTFTISAGELVWNWDTSSSNYAALRHARLAESGGRAWLLEAGDPFTRSFIANTMNEKVMHDPVNSGYGTPGTSPWDEEQADLGALFAKLDPASTWLSRLHGELSREALTSDLVLSASLDQSPVPRDFVTPVAIGTPPACPDYSYCGARGPAGEPPWGWKSASFGGSGGCAVTEGASAPAALSGLLLAASLLAARRRRADAPGASANPAASPRPRRLPRSARAPSARPRRRARA
jgi:hypothetical protein